LKRKAKDAVCSCYLKKCKFSFENVTDDINNQDFESSDNEIDNSEAHSSLLVEEVSSNSFPDSLQDVSHLTETLS
jgi:hypothetical protein